MKLHFHEKIYILQVIFQKIRRSSAGFEQKHLQELYLTDISIIVFMQLNKFSIMEIL